MVRMASIRSRGDSIIRVDIMAAALQPNPIAMVRDCLPCAPVFEQSVQVKGYPRQIAVVLEQREGGEEDGHGRQHHADNPGGSRNSPSISTPWSQSGAWMAWKARVRYPSIQPKKLASMEEGTFAPAIVK